MANGAAKITTPAIRYRPAAFYIGDRTGNASESERVSERTWQSPRGKLIHSAAAER